VGGKQVPFGYAQGRLFDCGSRDRAARAFAQDDSFWGKLKDRNRNCKCNRFGFKYFLYFLQTQSAKLWAELWVRAQVYSGQTGLSNGARSPT
jgi:hypothetical protein